MYLALLFAPESEKLLRDWLPSLGKLHVTVIHSKQAMPVSTSVQTLKDLPLPDLQIPIISEVVKFAVYGPPNQRTQVLELVSDPFWALRRNAEKILHSRYIKWSSQWPFSPHVSLGAVRPEDMKRLRLPLQLRFNRLEWR